MNLSGGSRAQVNVMEAMTPVQWIDVRPSALRAGDPKALLWNGPRLREPSSARAWIAHREAIGVHVSESDSEHSSADDLSLVACANRGEPGALEELYRRHRGWATAVANRFVSTSEDAHDVVQEAFLYFFGKFPGFELTAQLRTFLYPALKHIALGKKPKEQASADYEALAAERLQVQPRELSDMGRLLRVLPEAQREVVQLRFVDDLPLKDIAIALEIPLGTVKSRLHNALDALRAEHAELAGAATGAKVRRSS